MPARLSLRSSHGAVWHRLLGRLPRNWEASHTSPAGRGACGGGGGSGARNDDASPPSPSDPAEAPPEATGEAIRRIPKVSWSMRSLEERPPLSARRRSVNRCSTVAFGQSPGGCRSSLRTQTGMGRRQRLARRQARANRDGTSSSYGDHRGGRGRAAAQSLRKARSHPAAPSTGRELDSTPA